MSQHVNSSFRGFIATSASIVYRMLRSSPQPRRSRLTEAFSGGTSCVRQTAGVFPIGKNVVGMLIATGVVS